MTDQELQILEVLLRKAYLGRENPFTVVERQTMRAAYTAVMSVRDSRTLTGEEVPV